MGLSSERCCVTAADAGAASCGRVLLDVGAAAVCGRALDGMQKKQHAQAEVLCRAVKSIITTNVVRGS